MSSKGKVMNRYAEAKLGKGLIRQGEAGKSWLWHSIELDRNAKQGHSDETNCNGVA